MANALRISRALACLRAPAPVVFATEDRRDAAPEEAVAAMGRVGSAIGARYSAEGQHGWRKEANRVRSTLQLTRCFRTHLLAPQ